LKLTAAADHGAAEIDQDVDPDEHQPDHRGRSMESPSGVQRLAVEEPHRDAAPEQHDRGCDEERRQDPHHGVRRTVGHVVVAAGVVANEPPAGARQLQQQRRDQRESDEDVPRHEGVDAENDRDQLDRNRSEEEEADHCGQPLVAVGVQRRL
jgi:hypothetical protein